MNRRLLRFTILVAGLFFVLLAAPQTDAGPPPYSRANMQCGYPVSQQDLFYNYYVGAPGCPCGPPAQLYLCPRPTPALVGHTYYTYQPFLPHEMLYRHDRTYFRIHPDGTGVKTKVRWY